jgi:hypothetical protein
MRVDKKVLLVVLAGLLSVMGLALPFVSDPSQMEQWTGFTYSSQLNVPAWFIALVGMAIIVCGIVSFQAPHFSKSLALSVAISSLILLLALVIDAIGINSDNGGIIYIGFGVYASGSGGLLALSLSMATLFKSQ